MYSAILKCTQTDTRQVAVSMYKSVRKLGGRLYVCLVSLGKFGGRVKLSGRPAASSGQSERCNQKNVHRRFSIILFFSECFPLVPGHRVSSCWIEDFPRIFTSTCVLKDEHEGTVSLTCPWHILRCKLHQQPRWSGNKKVNWKKHGISYVELLNYSGSTSMYVHQSTLTNAIAWLSSNSHCHGLRIYFLSISCPLIREYNTNWRLCATSLNKHAL